MELAAHLARGGMRARPVVADSWGYRLSEQFRRHPRAQGQQRHRWGNGRVPDEYSMNRTSAKNSVGDVSECQRGVATGVSAGAPDPPGGGVDTVFGFDFAKLFLHCATIVLVLLRVFALSAAAPSLSATPVVTP